MIQAALALSLALTAQPLPAHPGDHEVAEKPRAASKQAGSKGSSSKKKDKPAWDVNTVHGPSHRIEFDVDEATWMTVDIDPVGELLVIDILGDLYTLPSSGGTATRITSGPAYDCQPRFSPDGKWIAFTSDRGGSDDLWIAHPDGTSARQISHDDDITVSCSAWSPNGSYLIGRKRLTDTSSLGSVELWIYHLEGGKGVQLTKKDELPDANDPVFSPDGRMLYYAARHARYQYDRDPLEGIWQIERRDTTTGETIALTGAPGGACRPQVSPDSKTLAFLRRDRTETQLVLQDLATGAQRLLDRRMERDLMEGFAQGGTAPWFAWTPDGGSLITSAQGRIVRIDAKTGGREPIPFKAHVAQDVVDALRFPVDLHGATFDTKINRWPSLSHDGSTILFSALGKLWSLPWQGDAKAAELASLPGRLNCPSFTPDGRKVLFTSWTDAEGGFVWSVDAKGGVPRRVTSLAGQVANPVASPDSNKIAYVRGSGAVLRGEDLTDEPWFELRVVHADGSDDSLVRTLSSRGSNRRMPRPSWSADGQRLYVQDDIEGEAHHESKTMLRSTRLDGTERRDHLLFPYAEEVIVSPDERWVAVAEQHDVYLVALPRLGQGTVEVALDGAALPRIRLSQGGGEWPRFTDDGAWLSWSHAGDIHRSRIADILSFATLPKKEDADDGTRLPESEKRKLGVTATAWKPEGTVAYVHSRLLPMKGETVIEDGVLVVERDRITAVGRAGDVKIPPAALVVDLSGRTVMPGFIDVHAHLHYGALDIFPERDWRHDANLAYGVTTVHDPSASTHEVFGLSELVRAGLMAGPRIFSTGYILYGADSTQNAVIKSLEDAERHVQRLQDFGAISVKSYMQPGRNQRQWVIDAARRKKMMVVPEGGGHLEMDMSFILDGHTGIEHALPVTPLYRDVVQLLARSGTGYTPTLLVAYGGLSGENWFYQQTEVWKDRKLLTFTPRPQVDARARRRPVMNTDDDWHHIDVAASAKKVVEAGGKVQTGAHGQLQGLGMHWEMWALAQGGMTPWQVLRAATIDGAHYLGLDREIGSLETGKLADFVVLGGNPLDDIRQTNTVEQVVSGGRRFDASSLDEIWPLPAKRAPYLWQKSADPLLE